MFLDHMTQKHNKIKQIDSKPELGYIFYFKRKLKGEMWNWSIHRNVSENVTYSNYSKQILWSWDFDLWLINVNSLKHFTIHIPTDNVTNFCNRLYVTFLTILLESKLDCYSNVNSLYIYVVSSDSIYEHRSILIWFQ